MSKLTKRITAMLLSGMLVIGSVPGSVFATSTDVDPGQTSEIVEEVFTEDTSEESVATTEEISEAVDEVVAEEDQANTSEESAVVEEGAFDTSVVQEDSSFPIEDVSSNEIISEESNSADTSYDASVEEAAQYYTITLDANGGYFENEWDDSIGDYAQKAEVINKLVPVDGTVAAFPVFTDQDGQAMLFAGWSLERNGELVSQAEGEYIPVDNCVLYAVWQAEDAALVETEEQEVADEGTEQADAIQGSEEVDSTSEETITAQESPVEEDTAYEANTVPETENEQDIESFQEAVSTNEKVENISEESSDAVVSEEDAQPQLNESSEKEETVKEDAANGVVKSGTCGDNLTWTLDEEGSLTISGTGEMKNYDYYSCIFKNYTVINVIIENGVSSIGNNAFRECHDLTSITIPDSVKSIGEDAFLFCHGITSVTIPDGVTNIGTSAFACCISLTSVTLPSSITSTGNNTFASCHALTSVIIPTGVTSIGNYTFSGCNGLTSVAIPNSVTSIGDSAFIGCAALTSVTIPNKVKSIGEHAFDGCDCLTEIYFYGCAPSISSLAFRKDSATSYYPINNNTWTDAIKQNYGGTIVWAPWNPGASGTCGDDLTWTLDEAGTLTISGSGEMTDYEEDTCIFKNYIINSVVINEGVTSIGRRAFNYCTSITSVTVPDSVTSVENLAFYQCSNLTSISIPNHVISIGDSAFYGCSALKSVTIQNGLVRIGNYAFYQCRSLTSVAIPNSVTEIGFSAFGGCVALSSVTIPNSVASIKDLAFSGCFLTNIYFSGNVPSIGSVAFEGVTATAYYPANDPTWTGDVRQNYGGNITWETWEPSDNTIEKIDSGFELQRDNNSFSHSSNSFLRQGEQHYCISDSLYSILKNRANAIQKMYLCNDRHFAKWGGSCEGLETTMSLIFSAFHDFFIYEAGSFWRITSPLNVNGLRDTINYYQLLYNDILKPDYSVNNKQDVRDFCRLLVSEAKKGEPFIFNYVYNEKRTLTKQELETIKQNYANYSTSGGHSAIVCGYKYVLNQDGAKEHQIKIYDCNDSRNYHWMTIPDNYSSFSYQDSNMHTVSLTLQNENRINLWDVYTTMTIRKHDSIVEEALPDIVFSDTRSQLNDRRLAINTNQLLAVSDTNESDMSYVIISFDRPFVLTNGAGESLVCDGIETSGDMPIFNSFITGGENHVTLQFETTKSSSFVVSGCDEGISLFTQVGNTGYSVDTNNASTVTISEESGVDITGDNISFVSSSIDSEAVDNIVTVSGETTGNCNIVRNDENVIVKSDSQIENIGISTENTEIFNEYTTVASENNYIINNEADEPVVTTRDEDGVFKPVEVINVNDPDVPTKLDITYTEITIDDSYIYTGEPIVPATTVKGSAGEELSEGTDYTINYADNINTGTATVTITGIGNYEGTVTKTFTINPTGIDTAEFSEIEPVTYTGKEQTPVPTVKVGEQTLKKDTDYTVSYANNTMVGTATVKITGKGNYTGAVSKTFKINGIPVSNATVSGISNKTYTGSAITQNPTVKVGDNTLTKNTDYTVSYANNTKVGTATVKITGKGNYTGTISKNFKISRRSIAKATISGIVNKTYTGSAKTQNPTVKVGDKTLKKGTDYTVSYANNINIGTATVTITGKGNYASKKTVSFKINKATQSITAKAGASRVSVGKTTTVSITGNKGKKIYKSSNTAIATVTSAGKVTAKKVGTVKITATSAATSNYNAASKTVTIKVVPAATASLAAANQVTGIKLTWKKVTGANGYKVYRGSTLIKTITSGSTVTYADTKANTNGTKYTYKVVAKSTTGDSTLSKSRAIYRVARPAITSLKNSVSKKMTVKWGKNAKATGYQIQYSTSKSFATGNKTATITSASTVSKVVGSLTKGKTYYVRIRTYKTVGSTKYWSTWSAAKSVKISK